jgi:hypothetical protein
MQRRSDGPRWTGLAAWRGYCPAVVVFLLLQLEGGPFEGQEHRRLRKLLAGQLSLL